eukprot:scaffold36275_cov154-Isochrysis_galbana.AAC.15
MALDLMVAHQTGEGALARRKEGVLERAVGALDALLDEHVRLRAPRKDKALIDELALRHLDLCESGVFDAQHSVHDCARIAKRADAAHHGLVLGRLGRVGELRWHVAVDAAERLADVRVHRAQLDVWRRLAVLQRHEQCHHAAEAGARLGVTRIGLDRGHGRRVVSIFVLVEHRAHGGAHLDRVA